jgi:hypothetical protein
MKKINISTKKHPDMFTSVSDADFIWLDQWKWGPQWSKHTQSFYACRNSDTIDHKKRVVLMHREILGLKRGNKLQGDHVNHDTLNNCRSNLRVVTHSENQRNRKKAKGYYWNKSQRKYQAQIKGDGKAMYLGLFSSEEDARNAYLQAKEKYHQIAPKPQFKSEALQLAYTKRIEDVLKDI